MSAFHFLRPAWFLALIPALLLLRLLWRRRGRGAGWQELVAPSLLAHLLIETGQSVRRAPLLLLGLGWLLAVAALAGPTWERQPQPVYRAPADRVIVLDMSPSMAAGDLKPDRLSRARFAIMDLLSRMKEGRTALVVFGAEPHVVAPLTDDVATIKALLPALSVDIMPVPGDQAGPALRLAGELLQRVGSTRGAVLLLSDGFADPADSLDATRALRRQGVQVSVLGVGTPEGAPLPAAGGGFDTTPGGAVRMARLDESGLAVVASAGGGHYQRLGTGEPVDLFDQAASRDPAQALTEGHGLDRWVERGPWLLLPLLVIAAAGFRRGWLGLLVLLLVPPPQAQAFGWRDLWMRPDQQASRLLERGEAKAAAERFQDPHWRATARYQAGDYAAAAAGFDGDAPDSLYNRGNALARAGHLQAALAAYAAALDRQPADGDARFNHDLVERLLRAQQAQSAQAQPGGIPQDRQQAGAGQSGSANDEAGSSTRGQQSGPSPAGSSQDQAGSAAQSGQAKASDSGDERQQSAGDGQSGRAPTGAAASPAGQPPADTQSGEQAGKQAGSPHDRDGDTVRTGQAPAEEHGAEQHASADDGQAGQTPSGSTAAENTGATPAVGPADSAERARADVAPAAADEHKPAQARPAGADQTDRKSEQDIAMEQWLRQVPDDPAGLLRRKFMLEHLLRQKGQ